jgi:hypothetical protein
VTKHCRDFPQGFSKNEALVAEILATRNKEQLMRIKMEYEQLYDKSLEEDLGSRTSGHLKRIFRSLLSVICRGRFDVQSVVQDA